MVDVEQDASETFLTCMAWVKTSTGSVGGRKLPKNLFLFNIFLFYFLFFFFCFYFFLFFFFFFYFFLFIFKFFFFIFFLYFFLFFFFIFLTVGVGSCVRYFFLSGTSLFACPADDSF